MANFISYLSTKSFRNNLIAAITTVIVLLIAAFFSLRYYTKHGEGLNVPAVKGLSFNQAVSKLEELGLRYEVDSAYIMDMPPGTVIDQDPEASTFVKGNRTIYLTINRAQAPTVKFPDVKFKSFIEAQSILNSYGLKIGDTVYKADVSRDVVLDISYAGQPILPGDIVAKGSSIDLLLGDGGGSEEVEIPNLLGFTKSEAAFSLRGSNLKLGEISFEGDITDTANAVIVAQSPVLSDTLSTVKIGSAVNITLSNKTVN